MNFIATSTSPGVADADGGGLVLTIHAASRHALLRKDARA
jgi:hypothetical protein